MLEALIFVVFPFCMVFAMVSDLLSMTIANRVSAILVVSFVIVSPFAGMDLFTISGHFAAAIVVLCVTFALFAAGVMGGGDAKLLASTALWMGPSVVLMEYLTYGAIFGGAITLAILMYRGSVVAAYSGHNIFLRNLADEKAGIPYGIALGAAGLYVYPSTSLVQTILDRVVTG